MEVLTDCILKQFRKTVDSSKIPLLQDSIDFKFLFYEKLCDLENTFNYNLNLDQVYFLNKFIKTRPFCIVECDKNIGSAIISNQLISKLGREHLDDNLTYSCLTFDPLNNTINKINDKLQELKNLKCISKRLYEVLKPLNSCLGKFRILPKLHKNKFGIRPIINCKNHPTSRLCKLIELILSPFVKKFDSYIQDSQNLLQKVDTLQLPPDCILLSSDFESLYTNIDLNIALINITEFAKDKLDKDHINTKGFHDILELILFNNVFSFENKYYIQIRGIAMGIICGPTLANVHVYIYEIKWLSIAKPVFYARYIDDQFIIAKKDFDFIFLKHSFEPLTLNILTGNSVVFLDLQISINIISNLLNFKLYVKPTNTFSYLFHTSNHPSFIFRNIPKSLFLRIKRICSFFDDYLYFSSILINQLSSRGYNLSMLRKVRHSIGQVNRNFLIPYKNKGINDFNTLFFKLPYEMNLFFTRETIKSFNIFFKQHELLKNFNLKVIYNTQPNLSQLLVHNFKRQEFFNKNNNVFFNLIVLCVVF